MKKIAIHCCCAPCAVIPLEYLVKKNFDPTIFYYNPNIHLQKEYNLRLASMQKVAIMQNIPFIVGSNRDFYERIKREKSRLDINAIKNSKEMLFADNSLMKVAIQKILDKWQRYAEVFSEPLYEKLLINTGKGIGESYSADIAKSLLAIDSYAFVKHLHSYKIEERCKECYKERMYQSVVFAKENNFPLFTSTLLYSKYQNHDDICKAIETAVQLVNEDSLYSSQNKEKLTFYYSDFREFWQEGIDKSKELSLYRQKWCGCVLSRLESLEQMAMREYAKLVKKNL